MKSLAATLLLLSDPASNIYIALSCLVLVAWVTFMSFTVFDLLRDHIDKKLGQVVDELKRSKELQ